MRSRYLQIFELREKALSAREKAADARRLARRADTPTAQVLQLHAAEFEAKAATLEHDIEDLGAARPL